MVKATETAVGTDGMLKEYEGWTNKFIFPPYDFGLADSMLVNFYHPYSTLLMRLLHLEDMILLWKLTIKQLRQDINSVALEMRCSS